jgi:ketosteroid isomerase-like protein
MSEESTTPDLVEKVRMIFQAVSRQDWDRVVAFYVPDAVFDAPALGQTFEGRAAIRALFVEWTDAYRDWDQTLDEVRDLGNGVVLALTTQIGRPGGSSGVLSEREALVYEWASGMITRITAYRDLDEAGITAERLAEERG